MLLFVLQYLKMNRWSVFFLRRVWESVRSYALITSAERSLCELSRRNRSKISPKAHFARESQLIHVHTCIQSVFDLRWVHNTFALRLRIEIEPTNIIIITSRIFSSSVLLPHLLKSQKAVFALVPQGNPSSISPTVMARILEVESSPPPPPNLLFRDHRRTVNWTMTSRIRNCEDKCYTI